MVVLTVSLPIVHWFGWSEECCVTGFGKLLVDVQCGIRAGAVWHYSPEPNRQCNLDRIECSGH